LICIVFLILTANSNSQLQQPPNWLWVNSPTSSSIYYPNKVGIGNFLDVEPSWTLHVMGDIGSAQNLNWNMGKSHLNTDQNGSIDLGDGSGHIPTMKTKLKGLKNGPDCVGLVPDWPYIDFHWGCNRVEDFNTRIINDDNGELNFVAQNGQSMTFNAFSNPTLQFTNNQNTQPASNSLIMNNIYGSTGIDFFGQQNYGPNIIAFWADYTDKSYDELSLYSDHTIHFSNDESWMGCVPPTGNNNFQPMQNLLKKLRDGKTTVNNENNVQQSSIHLNAYGSQHQDVSYIDFNYGPARYPSVDARILCTAQNQLDFYTGAKYGCLPPPNYDPVLCLNGYGTKIMTINNHGVFATAVTVQTSWPDFVFKSGYHLKPLAEVEKYIQQNGHLEDMPTDEEVKENGVELGNATSKLLQKVEELTLYVIDQKKEIDQLKKDNEKLKEAINGR